VEQAVVADGFRITVHRAYADRLGVRLATTVEDMEGRWSDVSIQDAKVIDDHGRVYEGWDSSLSQTPSVGTSSSWLRFLLPDQAVDGDVRLEISVTSIRARNPGPIPDGIDGELVWNQVAGPWRFHVAVPITHGWAISPPSASATGSGTRCSGPATCSGLTGVTIDLKELGVVPSGTLVRLAVRGLPEMPAGSVRGWIPATNIQHDSVTLDESEHPPGVLSSDSDVTIETRQVFDNLAGHWRISVDRFWTSGPPIVHIVGPWVLEFDVPETP
jgi:hypothetical protein